MIEDRSLLEPVFIRFVSQAVSRKAVCNHTTTNFVADLATLLISTKNNTYLYLISILNYVKL